MDKPVPPLRKRSLADRRTWWIESSHASPSQRQFFEDAEAQKDLADLLVENAVGWMPIPLGVVSGLVVNGVSYEVPLATEEPSVIAAASAAASVAARNGGFSAGAWAAIMTAQVFLEGCAEDGLARMEGEKRQLEDEAKRHLLSMERRGGGLRGLSWSGVPGLPVIVVNLDVDVRDAMGANLLNTLAEAMVPILEKTLHGKKLMAILSNDASARLAWAEVKLEVDPERARRIVLASQVAQADERRAVTHNKGIMNGITGLALATGNDTRALEAAVHRFAGASGGYRGLSQWSFEENHLVGRLTLPLPLATVGGSAGIHPTARMAWQLLGEPDSPTLCSIAAALGLAQNFSALNALVGEGIQKGHMALHERRTRTMNPDA